MAVPSRSERQRQVHLAGRVVTNPVANYSPILGCDIATATIEVDDMQFRVVGQGDVALSMAEAGPGSEAHIEGELVVHKRKTADNQEHEQWEIVSKSWKTIWQGSCVKSIPA